MSAYFKPAGIALVVFVAGTLLVNKVPAIRTALGG